jgi:protoporphyrin/coproporphyrin ferrochelatase
MTPRHTAVLLMAYGSPNRLDEVEAYFTDIRGGRRPSTEAIAELTERYRRVGVPTPLLAVSTELSRALEHRLNIQASEGERFSVHLGMKHWLPRISSAVAEIIDGGADHVVAIVLAPHFSRISSGGYRRQVDAALAAAPGLSLDFVESWHELPGYVEAVAENVRRVRAEFATPDEVVTVFTAHSLPARILDEGDPYQEQLLRTSRLVADRAGVPQWRFAYQSQSHTGEPWLGPDLLDAIEELASMGHRQILVASIGFIADHLEILYDIDIEAAARAKELGVELRRTPMLNADPRLVGALQSLVRQRVLTAPSLSA